MSDLFAPPPRRPAPEHLREKIARRLDGVAAPRRRLRIVLIPLAAAVMIATVLVGVAVLGNQGALQPVQTASPYPTTASPTPPRRTATTSTPTPSVAKAPTNIDVRPMTKAEIEADMRSCLRPQSPVDDNPRGGPIRVRYAMVQIQAGPSGTVSQRGRTLILQDDVGTSVCYGGEISEWVRGSLLRLEGRRGSQIAAYGLEAFNCRNNLQVSEGVLFGVGEDVVVGRTRIILDGSKGPWQTSKPHRSMVNFRLVLQGHATLARKVTMEFELLNRRGEQVTILWNSKMGGPDTGKTARMDMETCTDRHRQTAKYERITRPANDQAGITACGNLIKDSSARLKVPSSGRWKPRLVTSTKQQWGAVLSDGGHLVGCSLFPTKEISPVSPDIATLAKPSFYFAVNPIGANGASLWAAGKVPTDVSAISYRLPGGRSVAATIGHNGYWMLMYHSATTDIAPGNVTRWEPVEVTVTRPGGTETFSISFSEKTMCRQVSHGC